MISLLVIKKNAVICHNCGDEAVFLDYGKICQGFIYWLPERISKCKCPPVDLPVLPDNAIMFPEVTF
jgi:hypothetical protein